MRIVRASLVTAAVAGAVVTGAGAAQADQTVTANLQFLDCAMTADIMDIPALTAAPPETITVSDEAAAQLRQAGCL
ncbi:hypothetical protein [Nocardia stercoris]|uniref:Uncharacterized protein n=1 Tax=Nocardia stercoris TaxID=2483361 RepID=A0A3M2LBK5_9NOCA|nr:hypothetical protein [Nocardia stercoris]RMI34110.1 hypothetical protein EBN03_06680 [Nocardia stercoris]